MGEPLALTSEIWNPSVNWVSAPMMAISQRAVSSLLPMAKPINTRG